jgi:predicted small metal-binding protein
MTKHISCGDIFPGCAFEAEAATEEELLEKVAKHAAAKHGIDEVTPEVLRSVREAIHTHAPHEP